VYVFGLEWKNVAFYLSFARAPNENKVRVRCLIKGAPKWVLMVAFAGVIWVEKKQKQGEGEVFDKRSERE
jgi:hypothetical protein